MAKNCQLKKINHGYQKININNGHSATEDNKFWAKHSLVWKAWNLLEDGDIRRILSSWYQLEQYTELLVNIPSV